MKGFALGLALKQRRKATWKSPIPEAFKQMNLTRKSNKAKCHKFENPENKTLWVLLPLIFRFFQTWLCHSVWHGCLFLQWASGLLDKITFLCVQEVRLGSVGQVQCYM